MPKRRAVILDRDGVLNVPDFRNGRSYAPKRHEDFILYADAAPAVARLKAAGFLVVVATNQPDVGAGLVDRQVVEAMHMQMRRDVAIDDIEVCYDPSDRPTHRRKPGTGMLLDLAARWDIDLPASYMIGDRHGDIEAGVNAGCVAIFVDRDYASETRPTRQAVTVRSLAEAAAWILDRSNAGTIT